MGRGRRAPEAAPTSSTSPDDGAAAVEFALVAPLLIMLLFMVFGTGWGLWEYQGARATAREAARLASLGIPDATAYKRAVICLGERQGMRRGSLAGIDLAFRDTPSSTTATPASTGGYVTVTLTYVSMLKDLPLARWVFTDSSGRFRTVALTRVEQVPIPTPLAPAPVTTDQVVTVTNEVCP